MIIYNSEYQGNIFLPFETAYQVKHRNDDATCQGFFFTVVSVQAK